MANRTSINGPTRNPFGVSFIQTASGATITGEIKRYLTYQEMVSDPAPARLATVANGSHDDPEVYTVPEEHIGGVLYQRDFVTNTWVLLYTEKSLAVPTYIEWNYILNVPPWVGGVTHNRKKLVEDTVAELRTTYYSFDNFKLIIPPASTKGVELGEEIVLEQYSGYGAIIIPYEEGDITTTTAEIITDNDTGKTYQVIYTYAPATATDLGDDEHSLLLNGHAYVFHLICTEDDDGLRYWSLITTGDQACDMAQELHKEYTDHLLDPNPHNQYLRRVELGKYITAATPEIPGYIRLAVETDLGGDNNTKAITPYLLTQYVSQVLTVDSDLWKEYVDNKFNILRVDLDDHINNTDIHVTLDDKNRWNSLTQIAHDAGDMSYHLTDPLAHYDLFATKADLNHNHIPSEQEQANLAVNVHNDSENAHTALFAKKQDVLTFVQGEGIQINTVGNKVTISCTVIPTAPSEPDKDTTYSAGTYINITNDNVINSSLVAGKYVIIAPAFDEDGDPIYDQVGPDATYKITVTEASATQKGVTQLVTAIDDSNKDNFDSAVTPGALTNLFSLYEHISERFGAKDANGLRTIDSSGWVKFPSMSSRIYPGKCLAVAWGISPIYYDSELNSPLQFSLELDGCCKFYRLIYPIFDFVPLTNKSGNKLIAKKFDGTEEEFTSAYKWSDVDMHIHYPDDGIYGKVASTDSDKNPDVSAITKILLYMQDDTNKKRLFRLRWMIIGYTSAFADEVWDITPTVAVKCNRDCSGNNGNYWWEKALTSNYKMFSSDDIDYIAPKGWMQAYRDVGDHWQIEISVTWTIQRKDKDTTSGKKYRINGKNGIQVGAIATIESRYKDSKKAQTKVAIILNGAVIDMATKKITGIQVRFINVAQSNTNVAKTYTSIDMGNVNESKKLININASAGQIEPKSRRTNGYISTSYTDNAIQLKMYIEGWSQHDGVTYRCSYSPNDLITLTYS